MLRVSVTFTHAYDPYATRHITIPANPYKVQRKDSSMIALTTGWYSSSQSGGQLLQLDTTTLSYKIQCLSYAVHFT